MIIYGYNIEKFEINIDIIVAKVFFISIPLIEAPNPVDKKLCINQIEIKAKVLFMVDVF